MADEDQQQLTDAIVGDGDEPAGGGGGVMLWIVLGAVMALGAGGGFVVSRFLSAGPATAAAGEAAAPKETPGHPPVKEGDLAYLPVPAMIVNLNEERLTRYLNVGITFAVDPDDTGDVKSLVDKRIAEVKSLLNDYFCALTLEDVRGPKNLRRIQREIGERLNDRFWPEQKPRIAKVLLTEWHVQ